MTSNKPKYHNEGNVGAMGDNASSDNNIFVQTHPAIQFDLIELARQLDQVRAAMKERADVNNVEHDAEIGVVAQAEAAAKAGDKSKTLEFLKGAGTWTLDIAKSVAASLVKDAIEGKIAF